MMEFIFIIIYSFFAVRWGMRFVDGRWNWFEQPNHKIFKIIVAVILGYILAGLYFLLWCVKMIVDVLPRWLS